MAATSVLTCRTQETMSLYAADRGDERAFIRLKPESQQSKSNKKVKPSKGKPLRLKFGNKNEVLWLDFIQQRWKPWLRLFHSNETQNLNNTKKVFDVPERPGRSDVLYYELFGKKYKIAFAVSFGAFRLFESSNTLSTLGLKNDITHSFHFFVKLLSHRCGYYMFI